MSKPLSTISICFCLGIVFTQFKCNNPTNRQSIPLQNFPSDQPTQEPLKQQDDPAHDSEGKGKQQTSKHPKGTQPPMKAVSDKMITAAKAQDLYLLVDVLTKLKKGEPVDINQQDESLEYSTALHQATKLKDKKVGVLLINQGANIEAKNAHQATPLYLAAFQNNYDMVKLLIEKKAHVESANYQGHTPLAIAANFGHADIVKLLLAHHANIEAKDKHAYTPLLLAAKQGHVNVVKILIENNADIDAKNNKGRSALDIANLQFSSAIQGKRAQYNEVIKLLKKKLKK
jgi:ankyrin repeat protein